ncbi:OmpA family protein [Paragemmobacter straminiformis]|uniref:OmpA family protein n=1 Tax=Paragemmobacter straminiformis TaxID=2045119 RepID=A0A842IA19_9RHOB|nr:OmpA family protein [Gemmobacter straminiformis]MBC2836456.1 OmpA family protein [Gemmobacter straminiformis]
MTLRSRIFATLLALALPLVSLPAAPVLAQDASGMTAEELEALFKKQKTRGLVLAPAGEPAAAAPAAADATAATTETAAAPAAEAATTYVENDSDTAVNIQIKFDFDSAALRDDQKPKLGALCTVMQTNADWVFRIVGHTDAAGTADYNNRLSLLRAQEVARYISTSCSVSMDRLQAIGVGKDHLANEADPRSEENRRVEFQLLS